MSPLGPFLVKVLGETCLVTQLAFGHGGVRSARHQA
jgi:hypothetical protein